jgi:hypothetical protein
MISAVISSGLSTEETGGMVTTMGRRRGVVNGSRREGIIGRKKEHCGGSRKRHCGGKRRRRRHRGESRTS